MLLNSFIHDNVCRIDDHSLHIQSSSQFSSTFHYKSPYALSTIAENFNPIEFQGTVEESRKFNVYYGNYLPI